MARQPNGTTTIRRTARGFETKITVTNPDGTKRRTNVRAQSASEVRDRVKAIRDREKAGVDPTVASIDTVAGWLTHWNDEIVKPNLSRNYYASNRSIIRQHLIPHLGGWRLDGPNRLQPEHVTRMLNALGEAGLSSKYRHDVYVALNRALKLAMKARKTTVNVCELVEPPKVRERKVKALKRSHARAIIAEAVKDEEYGLRWLLAMVLGPRKGEVTGIRWPMVDLDPDDGDEEPGIHLETQLQRHSWEHGCADPVQCVRKLHAEKPHIVKGTRCSKWEHGCGNPESCTRNRSDRCPKRIPATRCKMHPGKKGCPPPCPENCTDHARLCPSRKGGGLLEVDLKTEGSERPQPLGFLVDRVREHRERQIRAYAEHGLKWDPQGFMFVRFVHGRRGDWRAVPVDPRVDHDRWVALLEQAGTPYARQHAQRHTAATLMLATGTPIEVVAELLGHASLKTAKRYAEAAASMKARAANKVAETLLSRGPDLAELLRQAGVDL